MDPTDDQRCAAAIRHSHDTIRAWLTGAATRGPDAFAAFADAHSPDFTMITPDGASIGRAELFPGFEAAHGSAPGLLIEISAVTLVRADADTVTATYVERHSGPSGATARRSTVLLDRHPSAPHGLRSRHLHETWIADV